VAKEAEERTLALGMEMKKLHHGIKVYHPAQKKRTSAELDLFSSDLGLHSLPTTTTGINKKAVEHTTSKASSRESSAANSSTFLG
jgi:hypothetical protein